MTRVRVVPAALGCEVDIGVFVENLHDGSDLFRTLRVDDTGWLYVAQGGGPVLLRLGDIVQLKGPRQAIGEDGIDIGTCLRGRSRGSCDDVLGDQQDCCQKRSN